MALRTTGVFALSFFLAAPLALAVDNGKAEGTVTINKKPIALKYAFAKKETDRWVVMLTDRAVAPSLLGDDARLQKAIESGQLVMMRLQFDEKKQLEHADVYSKTIQHKQMPMSVSAVKMTGAGVGANSVEGGAVTTEEQTFFKDAATLDVKFRAPLGTNGRFGDSPASAKELAGSAPRIADGGASGTLTLDGKPVKLAYAVARTKPNTFDKKKQDIVVLLTDHPATAEMLADTWKLSDAASKGSIRGLLVTIDSDQKPYHLQFLDPKTNLQVTGAGSFNFDPTDFSDKHVAGKFFTTSAEDFGEHKYSYDVTFAVAVQTVLVPSEVTLDAASGTKLPASGGDAGVAYMAFDKASRAGNLAEMKKYVSKTRPLPPMSAEETKQMVEVMKMMRPAKLKVTGGFTKAEHATLTVEAEDPSTKAKVRGTIEMAREDGTWKVLQEAWAQ